VTSSGAVPGTTLRRPPLRAWIWTAGVLALLVVAVVLWRSSDARATSSTTAPRPGPASGSPARALSQAWSVPGDALPEQVVQQGRVIVGSGHGVTALDPATGREVWHYTRSNRRLCGLTATDGVAVAVYATGDRCDQAVALDAGTGVRTWNRNLDLRPDVRLTSTTGHVLAVSPTGVVDLDPTGDNIRWGRHAPQGCTIADARAGSSGMVLLQRCPGAASFQVILLDGSTGTPHWTRDLPAPDGADVRLAGADELVTVVVGDELRVLAAGDGGQRQSVGLPSQDAAAAPTELSVPGTLLLWAHGTVLSLDPSTGAVRWMGSALGLPSVEGGGGQLPANAAVVVPEAGAFVVRDSGTGAERGRSTASGVPDGGVTAVVGSTVVYRLPGRVLGYR
jgi:outer membrane protein assembly factor BamB